MKADERKKKKMRKKKGGESKSGRDTQTAEQIINYNNFSFFFRF